MFGDAYRGTHGTLTDAAHGHAPGPEPSPGPSPARPDSGEPQTHYAWNVHHPYGGVEDHVAVEVRPHFGFVRHWRFVLPSDYDGVVAWGVGPPHGEPIGEQLRDAASGGPVQLMNGPEVVWFGAAERLSASNRAAYLVFHDPPPHYVSFGEAEGPGEPPNKLEGISFGDSHEQLAHAHDEHDHAGQSHDHSGHDHDHGSA